MKITINDCVVAYDGLNKDSGQSSQLIMRLPDGPVDGSKLRRLADNASRLKDMVLGVLMEDKKRSLNTLAMDIVEEIMKIKKQEV